MSNNCVVKQSAEKGVGLYACKNFSKGDIVLVCEIENAFCQNSVHASQIEMGKFHTFSLLGRSINHSCEPNVGIGFDGKDWLYLAFKDISEGDELFYDYGMANYVVQNFPECQCGSKNCRKNIQGYQNLPLERKRAYTGFMAPYLEKKFKEQTP